MRRLLVALIAIAGVAWAQTVVPPFGAASAPVATPPQATASAPAPVQPPQPPQPAFVQPPAPPVAARTPAPPAAPTPPVKGLPADAPKLVVNGGTYSERRDMRLAIVNGNVVREGANVDGVVVEQIQPDGLVLAFRGSRYHVTY
jgi:general secretion pathway protein B